MNEARPPRVEEVSGGRESRGFLRGQEESLVYVQEISADRVAYRRHVNAYLVLAPGEGRDAEKGVTGKTLDDGVSRRRFLAIAATGHLQPHLACRVRTDGEIDYPFFVTE